MSEVRGYPNPNYTEEDLVQQQIPLEAKADVTLDETVIISPEKFEQLCSKAAALDILTAHINKTGKVDDDIVYAITGTTDIKVQNKADDYYRWWCDAREERDKLKEDAERANDLQKQLDDLSSGEDFQKKYEEEHRAFEDFRKKTASEAEAAKIRTAYRKLLAAEGISEKRLDSILKVTDMSKMKLDKDGNLEDLDSLKKSIGEEWGEFKTTIAEKGAVVEKPLQTGKPTKTKEEIFAIKDTAERQRAIAENHELFGF